jgi:hypothetical protein
MARKKTSQPKGYRGKGIGKDPQGTRFISDFVYEGQTAIDKVTNYGTRFGENPKLEFEYDRQYLAYTTVAGEEIKRKVYIGDFDITKDGIIRRATVSEERLAGAYPGMPPQTIGVGVQPTIYQYAPFTLENVDGLVRFWAASVTARRATENFYITGDTSDPINQKFFPNEWWNNPFASNLL